MGWIPSGPGADLSLNSAILSLRSSSVKIMSLSSPLSKFSFTNCSFSAFVYFGELYTESNCSFNNVHFSIVSVISVPFLIRGPILDFIFDLVFA